jgi:rfaE bifunctional protein kinase chain/domain
MNPQEVKEILDRIRNVTVAVCGDFCLDAYWILDPKGGEISVETGLRAQAVRKHYYSLGGASNIVANLAALKPAGIKAVGVVGDDIFGRELVNQLAGPGVDVGSMLVQTEDFDTVTFAKRYISDVEEPRIDFGFFNKRSVKTDEAILRSLGDALESCDAVILNQQVPGSFNNEEFIGQVNALVEQHGDAIILLDSRHYGHKFKGFYRKTNEIEAARLNGIDAATTDVIGLGELKVYAQNLYRESDKPVFVTRGPRGIVTIDAEGVSEVPGIQILKKTDPVGAGDTTVSALALALAAGVRPARAAAFANLAAAVTVQKLFRTGTACGEEILEISRDADYIYQPELASDIRQARYVEGTEIEMCYPHEAMCLGKVRHAVFDHDGTISTLRQGWETIMEPVMVRAILGEQYATADETLYQKVRSRVLDYIHKSTGLQTVIQMENLVEMVGEFGIVPRERILDKHGYKRVYDVALMDMVNKRITRLQSGQLNVDDYTVKGAVGFLKLLNARGITLYLASGSDCEGVVNEATVLGYVALFGGRIYGAVEDVRKYSKKMVIEKIMVENELRGPDLAVFGDGPVEIRESRKRDGVAVGVASDEVRRHGLNKDKRARLVKAGAHIIIPDFSQPEQLIKLLLGKA